MALPKVAVVNGSLRKDSINKKLALAIAKLAAGRLDLKLVDISALPLYNQDLEADFPAAAKRVKAEIDAADAVLRGERVPSRTSHLCHSSSSLISQPANVAVAGYDGAAGNSGAASFVSPSIRSCARSYVDLRGATPSGSLRLQRSHRWDVPISQMRDREIWRGAHSPAPDRCSYVLSRVNWRGC